MTQAFRASRCAEEKLGQDPSVQVMSTMDGWSLVHGLRGT